MATIRRRENANGTASFHVQIRMKGHPAVTESFERKTDAKRWAEKTEADMRQGRFFPERVAAKRTLGELCERYAAEVSPTKKDGAKSRRMMEWWTANHGYRVLADLSPQVLAEIRDAIGSKTLPDGKRISGATVNRYLAALSHAFTMASREWGWMNENPLRRVTKKKESRGRVRMLSDDEQKRLLEACKKSGCGALEPAVVLALCTGMRQGEITGLRWPDVDLRRGRLTLHDTKNGERRGVPLAGPALEVLKELSRVRRVDTDLVLPGTGALRHAWSRVVKKAKLENFRFHDLRHTAASYLAMGGCTPSEIAGVLGHKTLAMVKRYAHLDDPHIAGVVKRMVAANITEAWESSRSSSSTPSTGDNVLSLDIASRKRGTA
jgi:integrase